MNQENVLLDIGELLQQANALQVATWQESDVVPITERTFRYWVKQGLIERRGSRGAGAKYPKALVNRLLFIRMLQKKGALSLENIRTTITSVDEETIRRVVMLEERLDLVNEIDSDSARARMESGEQMVPLTVDAVSQSKQRNRVRPEPPSGRGAIDLKRRQGEVMDQLRRIEDRIDAQEAFFHREFMDAQDMVRASNSELNNLVEDAISRVAVETQRSRVELSEEFRGAQDEIRALTERLQDSIHHVRHVSDRFDQHRDETSRAITDLASRFDKRHHETSAKIMDLAYQLKEFISESREDRDDKGN